MVEPHELPQDGLVLTSAVIGAPTVILEKIPAGIEFITAVRAMARYLGQEPVALMPIEVGGMNTLVPLAHRRASWVCRSSTPTPCAAPSRRSR